MSYVYKRSEPQLWTVGYYDPAGKWQPESDHGTEREAGDRVRYLNGGAVATYADPANSTIELFNSAIGLLEDPGQLNHSIGYSIAALASAQVALVELAQRQTVALEKLAGVVSVDGQYLDVHVWDQL